MSVIKSRRSGSNGKRTTRTARRNASRFATHDNRKKKGRNRACVDRKATANGNNEASTTDGNQVHRFKSKRTKTHFREALIAHRATLTGQIGQLQQVSAKTTGPRDSDEVGGGLAQFRRMAISIAETEASVVYDIDEALRKLYEGGFGFCEQCNMLIEMARLEAIPYARRCVGCQEAIEQMRGGTRLRRPASKLLAGQLQREKART